jgi:hypothetical protein
MTIKPYEFLGHPLKNKEYPNKALKYINESRTENGLSLSLALNDIECVETIKPDEFLGWLKNHSTHRNILPTANLLIEISRAANAIALATRRGIGNAILTNANVKKKLESHNYFAKMSSIYTVEECNELDNEIIIGYKGKLEYDAGFYYDMDNQLNLGYWKHDGLSSLDNYFIVLHVES